MKICMFTNTYLPHMGGVAKSVAGFAEDLRARGHDVSIIAPVYENDLDNSVPDPDVFRLPAIQNFNGSDFSLSLPSPFLVDEHLDKFEPDIIHSHHPYLLGDTALRVARQKGLPLVFTHHTLYENYTHYTPLESESMRRFVINLSTEYANLCTRVIAPSRSVADLITRRGVASPILEIPTGVDEDFFASADRERMRSKLKLSENDFAIGHLGRLAPEKNLEYLAEASADFVKQHDRTRFLVVGSGPSREAIEKIFITQGIEERLILAGQMSGRDLADVYGAMDLFVFSSHSETQGMVLTEAMAAGKPVIALDAPGAREVVRDKQNGRLLDAEASISDFSRAIAGLYEDEALREKCSRAALETAHEFSRQVCSEKLEELYFSLVEDRGRVHDRDDAPWFSILERLKAEWELVAGKTVAVMEALTSEDDEADFE